MKLLFTLVLSALLCFIVSAQAPNIQWKQTFGGSGSDQATSMDTTLDGGFVVAGSTSSNNGDVSGNHGGTDGWVIKFDKLKIVKWKYTYGGSGDEYINSIRQTADSGYIVAGYTTSLNVNGYQGATDFWVAKLNKNGTMVWQRAMGGTGIDIANAVRQTIDGDYIIAGISNSNDGDLPLYQTGDDAWLVKLNSTGTTIQWQKVLGGVSGEAANDIQQTADSGYIMVGYSQSSGYDVPYSGFSSLNCWIVKLNQVGNIQWNKVYGGNANDVARTVQQTTDGGYIVAGGTNSIDGNVSGYRTSTDFWVLKLNSNGGLQWQKPFGFSSYDIANSVKQTCDGNYIVVGEGNNNLSDFLVIKLNSIGTILWQKTMGGTQSDRAAAVQPAQDGGILFAGITFSSDGDVTTPNHGAADFWVLKSTPPLGDIYLNDPREINMVSSDGSIKTDLSAYPLLSSNVKGAATDGVTKIVLTAEATDPVTFSLDDVKDGKLSSLTTPDQTNISVTVTPVNGRIGIIYTSPDGYGATNPPGGRKINVDVTTSQCSLNRKVSIDLRTPPVVLVHGMWSGPEVWGAGGFNTNLKLAGFKNIQWADYSERKGYGRSASTFNPNNREKSFYGRKAVSDEIDNAIKVYKNEKIAATQVDVVGHSLGGLMTRSYAQQSEFKIIKNYLKGSIHKLITLGTPHRGSPLGPELWNSKDNSVFLAHLGSGNLNNIVHGKITLADLLEKRKVPIGPCHPDFGIDSPGILALENTPSFKTFAIIGNYESPTRSIDVAEKAFRVAAWYALDHSYFQIMSSRCVDLDDVEENDVLPNDLIVPVKSQSGYLPQQYQQIFIGTGHSGPSEVTETNNPAIISKVIALLLSDSETEFANGFPKPSIFPKDCETTHWRSSVEQNKNAGHRRNSAPPANANLQITSPVNSTVYQQHDSSTINLQFTSSGIGLIDSVNFYIPGVGGFMAPSTAPQSVTVTLPASIPLGKLVVSLLAKDTLGLLYFDTASIIIKPNGILDSIVVQSEVINVDSSIRESSLSVNGFYTSGNSHFENDIRSGDVGTTYLTLRGDSIVTITNDGIIKGVRVGTDTIIVSNMGKQTKVIVIVDSNFSFIQKFENSIAFDSIPAKIVSPESFLINAATSSGEKVNYSVVSGSAQISNNFVTVAGLGTVTIKASSPGNTYFDSAVSVTRSFTVYPASYTFTGNGNWNVASNWSDNIIPPSVLPEGGEIIINPSGSGECVLNILQTVSASGQVRVMPGKKFKVLSDLKIQ